MKTEIEYFQNNLFMKFTLLTYNVLFNKAFPRLPSILEQYQPDIVCLQEVDTSEENLNKLEKYGYRLADYANCFIEFGKIWGVATYFKPDKFNFLNSKPILLSNGFYELLRMIIRMFKNKGLRRTILKTNLDIKLTKKTVTVYNLHLSAISLNSLRIKQLKKIDLDELDKDGSVILTGDFNFPIERKKLEDIMNKYRLKEATHNLFYTMRFPVTAFNQFGFIYRLLYFLFSKVVRKIWVNEVKLDYIFYRGLKNISTQRLDYNDSDHFPILSKFEL